MSKKRMEELLEPTKKEGTSHVTLNAVPSVFKDNIAEAIPLATTFVVSTSKAPTNTLWAEHLREFDKGEEESFWNLSIDRSDIVDEHIMRPADQAKFTRAGDVDVCKALTSHNMRSIAMVRHLERAIIQKDVSIETLKNKIANLEKELAEKDKLATAYSNLKKEKKDLAAKYKTESLLWTQQKKKLEDDVLDHQRGFAAQYRDGFENAISHIRILAPYVDVSKADMYTVVRNGMIVDEEEEEET
jgi:hypothetical protein